MHTDKSTAIASVIKRDGSLAAFDTVKIKHALTRALTATDSDVREASLITDAVVARLENTTDEAFSKVPSVERIQDVVEEEMMRAGYTAAAKAYILYRDRHATLRSQDSLIAEEVQSLVDTSKQYFSNQLSEYIYYSTYSRWLDDKNRREAWVETVGRYVDYMRENLGDKLTEDEYSEVLENMLSMKAMGSMRLLWSAGAPARASNVCVYNCSFIAPSCWQDFAEIMYISMCGTGVGFSVERKTVDALPSIDMQTGTMLPEYVVEDSKEGWADALTHGLSAWATGNDVTFNYDKIRPRGARLRTMGGRASGPEPLKSLLDFARERILDRQGRKLSTLDVHDLVCKVGEIVVAGGVRRSALISLSDLDDIEMREAKNGKFYITNPQRAMANNSAVYNEKPSATEFMEEWLNLAKSGSGERGIFNRGSLKKQLPERRWSLFEKDSATCGTNPCGEIILKSKQFCNLSEVVVRPDDTLETLTQKIRVATILGTYQASLTDFPYLSPEWKKNCEEEALLGVSMTGQWDNIVVRDPEVQAALKQVALDTNKQYAKRFGINPSTAITAVKPSGNGSQLFDCASGMHPRHSKYYIRRVRIEGHNPLKRLLEDAGVPCLPETGQTRETANTWVLEFPIKAPEDAAVKGDHTALDQLAYWKMVKEQYCEHNPSVTVTIAPDEWLAVGEWVYRHWDIVGGLSFLPKSDHVYQLAPYEEINKEQYLERAALFPAIDFAKLLHYETSDTTTGAKELACVSGTCEIDVLTPMPT